MITIQYYLNEGTILKKRYRIIEPLGRGGFGMTYLCSDFHTGNSVAVKEFFPRGAEREGNFVKPISSDLKEAYFERLSSFSEEFTIMSKIDDDRVVKVLDLFTENNTAYYVMEFISGRTLRDSVKSDGVVDESKALEIIDEILKGVSSIHERGYIHGDLKPTNVMLTDEGKIKVMDFGAACLKDVYLMNSLSKVVSLSYTCPEKFLSSSTPSYSWDVYSVGGILFFLLSGEDPIPSTERIKGIPLVLDLFPRKARRILEKSMSLVADKRYTDADHFRKALRARLFGF